MTFVDVCLRNEVCFELLNVRGGSYEDYENKVGGGKEFLRVLDNCGYIVRFFRLVSLGRIVR